MCKRVKFHNIHASDEELIAKSPVVGMPTDSTQNVTKEAEAQALIGDFEAYSNSLQENNAESQMLSLLGLLLTHLNNTVDEVELLGRLKLPRDITERHPAIVQPVSRVTRGLPSTQVFVERRFSPLKLVLSENRAQMGSDFTDANVFMKTNKVVYVLLDDFLTN